MATELGQAYVQIMPSAKGIGSSISNILNGEAGQAGDVAGGLLGGNLIKKVGAMIAAAGIGKMISDGIGASLSQGAELQQNLGGTQAVFGEFANSIQTQAQTAYKNMGLSASDYMATANKMGSLFQGSGVAQEKALEMTSNAMQRAADVASVMGVDMQMAMESVAGAAKGNFTMMDNLGVKMDATSISAYALEKGLNFKWNTASEAEKAEVAMQMFMERTSQYAGNFAKEANGTFSGSLEAMKASWQNVLGSLSTGADLSGPLKGLAESASAFVFNNLIPMLGNIFKGFPTAIGTFIAEAGPQIASQIQSLFSNIGIDIDFSGLSTKFSGIITAVQPVIDGFKTAFGQLPGLFQSLMGSVGPVIDVLATGFSKLDFSGIQALIKAVIPALQAGFERFMSIAGPAIESVVSSFVSLWNAAQPLVSILSEALMPAFEVVGSFLGGVFSGVLAGLSGAFDMLKVAIEFLTPVIQFLVDGFIALEPVFSWIAEKAGFVIGLFSNLSSIGQGMGSMIQSAWTNIQGAISTASSIIGNIIDFVKNAFNSAGSASNLMNSVISGAFNFVKNVISNVGNAIQGSIEAVKSVFTSFGDTVSSIAQTVIGWVDDIKNVFDSVKNIDLSAAGKAIIDGFLGGLKKGWDAVTGFVGGIAGWIADNKGPIEYDRILLKPHGGAIMGGLNDSLIDNFKRVKKTVGGMAGALSDIFGIASLESEFTGKVNQQIKASLSQIPGGTNSTNIEQQNANIIDLLKKVANRPINVPLYIDGREFARATAQPMSEEQDNLQTTLNIINGMGW